MSSGELGKIRYIYSQRLNLGRIRTDVDALWNLAPHDISIIQYWLDDPSPIEVNRINNEKVNDSVNMQEFHEITAADSKYPKNIDVKINLVNGFFIIPFKT